MHSFYGSKIACNTPQIVSKVLSNHCLLTAYILIFLGLRRRPPSEEGLSAHLYIPRSALPLLRRYAACGINWIQLMFDNCLTACHFPSPGDFYRLQSIVLCWIFCLNYRRRLTLMSRNIVANYSMSSYLNRLLLSLVQLSAGYRCNTCNYLRHYIAVDCR